MIESRERIILDTEIEDFTKESELGKYIHKLQNLDFQNLIEFEIENVREFLLEWQRQLSSENEIWKDLKCEIDLIELFRKTPKLSGVLYFSKNSVFNENIFDPDAKDKKHFTDRMIRNEIKTSLPSTEDLSFSFPRKYCFEGYYNSWGFVRVERTGSNNGAAIALSVTTLDHKAMRILKHYDFEHLAELYNEVWDYAIHDYIHHIGLYTNPSFAIGKLSPMSIENEHFLIDQWGEKMLSTFNYEYWAHSTHREITKKLLNPEKIEIILSKAKNYFQEVHKFLQTIIANEARETVQKIGSYLTFIYLWPLHILFPPYGEEIDQLAADINVLEVLPISDKPQYVLSAIKEGEFPKELNVKASLLLGLKNDLPKIEYENILEKLSFSISSMENESLIEIGSIEEWIKLVGEGKLNFSIEKEKVLADQINFYDLCEQSTAFLVKFLKQCECLQQNPVIKGLSACIKYLNIPEKLASKQLTWFDLIRFKTDMIAQRGLYEKWFHKHPIFFENSPITPMRAMLKFLDSLYQTLPNFHKKASPIFSYTLGGITP